jgi:hypothetical protein
MKRIVLTIVVMFFISCTSSKHTLRNACVGYVFNEDGKPVKGVKIGFLYDSVVNFETNTDEEGYFIVKKIEVNYYRDLHNLRNTVSNYLILESNGYERDTINLKNKTGNTGGEDTLKLGTIYLKKDND